MFIGSVDLRNGTGLELVIVPLKGSTLRGQWEASTDLLMLCDIQKGRCCTCRASTHFSRLQEELGLSKPDAEGLAEWLKNNLTSERE